MFKTWSKYFGLEAQSGSSREQGLVRLGPMGHVCTTPFHVISGQPNH
ncbi:unnamed protein product [Spirodela intermedia]|uniref:Uncharacterized protein n=1 Tax=Spirodela intermedia TaxID=51605 RepID=A0A7I8JPH6_SPIIN|nr:unnamed protein product [Spirodela intermedia]CAA6672074.1 unnamed protein product [Spirodela intermedia]